MLAKPENQSCLNRGMVMLTHITLLNAAVNKVAVRAIAGPEVFAD